VNIVIHDNKKRLKLYTSLKTSSFPKLEPEILSWLMDGDVLIVDKACSVSKIQLNEWLNDSSWFDSFDLIDHSLFEMIVIFYDSQNRMVHICNPNKGLISLKENNKKIMNILPEIELALVESADLMTRKQFSKWLESDLPLKKETKFENKPKENKKINVQNKYIHTVHDGTVLVEDILISGTPLKLKGKYHFVPINSFGGESALENSVFYRTLLKKNKVELVDEEFVEKNKHKYKEQTSLSSTLEVGNVDDFFDDKKDDTIHIPL